MKPRRRLSTSFASSQQEMAEIHRGPPFKDLLGLGGKGVQIADAQPNPDMGIQENWLHWSASQSSAATGEMISPMKATVSFRGTGSVSAS